VFRGAWHRFRTQKGTKFSFMDATATELMQRNSIRNIATFDRAVQDYGDFTVMGE